MGVCSALLCLLLDLLRVQRRLLPLLISELDLLLFLLLLVLLLRILVHFLNNHRLLCLFIVACLIATAGVICSSAGIGKLVASSSQLGMLRTAGDLLGFVPTM